MSVIWYWKAPISKWTLTTKAFLMHVLKALEDRCSNNYSLFGSTGNEDNYFPLRSGIQHELSADLTDFESGNCWAWPHLIRALVSLFKREEYIEDSDFQEITLISLSAANPNKEKSVRISPSRLCTGEAKFMSGMDTSNSSSTLWALTLNNGSKSSSSINCPGPVLGSS